MPKPALRTSRWPTPPSLTAWGVTYRGPDAATRLVENTEADVVLNALVGALGLEPTLAALASGARLALANKESLVAGGPLVLNAAGPGQIVPVDSEHSALAQCLRSGSADEVAVTGADGVGRALSRLVGCRLAGRDALTGRCSPHLEHGADEHLEFRVLVNKGLELIETHLLFGVPYDRIDVVVHPQSIVHSMVTFVDGPSIAQTSPPDMKLPFTGPGLAGTACLGGRRMRLHDGVDVGIEPLDNSVFPAVDLADTQGVGWLHDGGLQRRQRRGGRCLLGDGSDFPRSCNNPVTSCAGTSGLGTSYREEVPMCAAVARGTGRAVCRRQSRTPHRRLRFNPMMFAFGIVLFSAGHFVSVALHRCGHMWVARATA